MSDHDDEVELDDMDSRWEKSRWERVNDDFIEFEKIPEAERPFSSPDLCAWALLDKRFPSERNADMVSSAEHDQIWLRIKPGQIAQFTDDEILYLTRCGVMYDDDMEVLSMFV